MQHQGTGIPHPIRETNLARQSFAGFAGLRRNKIHACYFSREHAQTDDNKPNEIQWSPDTAAKWINTSASYSSASAALSTSAKKRKITDHFQREDNTVEKKVLRMVSKGGLPFRDLFKVGGYNLPTFPNSIKSMKHLMQKYLRKMRQSIKERMRIMSDLANEELDNDEDGRFDLSFSTSGEINLDTKYVEVIKKVKKPVKLAVGVLRRRDSNLITAKTTLMFVIRKFKNFNKPLSQKRIAERRTNLTAALLYLHNPFKYEEDRTEFMHVESFNLPPKNVIRKEIKTIVERLEFKENYVKTTATADDSEDDVPLANLESSLAALATPMSLQDELELTLTGLKTSETPQPRSGNNNLKGLIKKKMNYFESGGLKGTYF
ncbi:hypothetical protein ILUMI_03650 [Ignelater luminosus]|uniref:Uncharacterized protein n=1 Tax=Ignelater luminosus TaxID=2038154 RepID=A0A8K0DFY6_IGNLU|nr:hypothetical protein ILUMI_03650 [Ignelater luminosus]